MKRAMMVVLLATTAALAGCEDKPQGTSPAPSGEAAASVKDDDLVTPADFDNDAEKSVTAANYKQELEGLEKEMNSEP